MAGALTLEVGNPAANPEAHALKALVVARVTACHEPDKSVVTASLLQSNGGSIQRTPLEVTKIGGAGTFAIIGAPPASDSVVELAVTNPEYKNYQPRVLIHADANGLAWGSLKRFYSTPPTDEDIRVAMKGGTATTARNR